MTGPDDDLRRVLQGLQHSLDRMSGDLQVLGQQLTRVVEATKAPTGGLGLGTATPGLIAGPQPTTTGPTQIQQPAPPAPTAGSSSVDEAAPPSGAESAMAGLLPAYPPPSPVRSHPVATGPTAYPLAAPARAPFLAAQWPAGPGTRPPGTRPPALPGTRPPAPPGTRPPAWSAMPPAAPGVPEVVQPAALGAAASTVPMAGWTAAPGVAAHIPTPPFHAAPAMAGPAPVRRRGAWADTTGSQLLGWVGGGVTVLGVVLLLVIGSQQGWFGPWARVISGVLLGAALVVGAVQLNRKPERHALAVTVAGTGLAAEYLSVAGASALWHLVPAVVGFVGAAVITLAGVAIAVAWREPWLAGASFLVTGFLAPAVGGGVGAPVLIFEAIVVAGGAVALLAGVGPLSWAGAGIAAGVVTFTGLMDRDPDAVMVAVVGVMAVITWVTFGYRWVSGRAPISPEPFPLRVPSTDLRQVARDYEDFHRHTAAVGAARTDRTVCSVSLAVASALLLIAVAVQRRQQLDTGSAILAGGIAVVFVGIMLLARRIADPQASTAVTIAWVSALSFAAVAALRAVDGQGRGVVWMLLAALAMAVAAAERTKRLFLPALATAGWALLVAVIYVTPGDLLAWPSRLSGPGVSPGGGGPMAVPIGLGLVLVAALSLWAVVRCTADAAAVGGQSSAGQADGRPVGAGQAGAAHGWVLPTDHRAGMLTWVTLAAVLVALYGAAAVTMVIAYAIAPTRAGYQGGQVAMTVLITVVGLTMLWQGFRRAVLRIGGLALAGVAVGKLLVFDTRSLSALPRALTFIGVGVLLLIGAMIYLRTMARVGHGQRPTASVVDGRAVPPAGLTPPRGFASSMGPSSPPGSVPVMPPPVKSMPGDDEWRPGPSVTRDQV